MTRFDLATAPWTVEACGDAAHAPPAARGRMFPARVPGCVHSDLVRAGVIRHPDVALHEQESQWIGGTDWRYRCRFEVSASLLHEDRVDLVLDGLDTIARISLNGGTVGETMNMHHAHRFSVRPLLREGDNELLIALRGPVAFIDEQQRRLGSRPVNGDWLPYSYMRKMACNFQWDWGPRVATCGVWRGAWMEAWSAARIAGVRPLVLAASPDHVDLRVHVDIERTSPAADDLACSAVLRAPDGAPVAEARGVIGDERSIALDLAVARPSLWWPRGFGEPALHALQVTIAQQDEVINGWRGAVGLRTVRLRTEPDDLGSALAIEVNNRPIFCRGANWIPEGLFPEDQSPQRIEQRIAQAADANMNMLRVWGGGAYEQDAFYRACDAHGLMVWQDFMFACATYPQDDPYPALIEREAREVVTRLAHHPSIVIWCGGNENVLGYESWGWKQRMPREQAWGARYFFDLLPRVVRELDPSRPYWPDSPYSGERELPPNDPNHGDRHTWDAKVEGYREMLPRFCSEFGHQSPACWATLREAWGEYELRLDSRAMAHRQRAAGGNETWYGRDVLGRRFAAPRDFDRWLYLAHLLQARAMSLGIEWLRAGTGDIESRTARPCMGALVWQLNDAWAGHSWSCIDSAGRRKPAWHAIRRSFAPRLLTIQPIAGALRLCAVNDSLEPWQAQARVRRMNMAGATLAGASLELEARAGAVHRSGDLLQLVGSPAQASAEFLVADVIGAASPLERAWWFFDEDRALAYPPPRVDARVESNEHGLQLTLKAKTLLRDVVIAADRIDAAAEADDGMFTMLPGETRVLRIATHARATNETPADAWTAGPVFQCANG